MSSFVRVLCFVAFILAGPVVAQEADVVVVNDVVESAEVDAVTGTNGVDVFPEGVEIVAVPDAVDVDVSVPGEDVEDLVNLGWPSDADIVTPAEVAETPDVAASDVSEDTVTPVVADGTDGSDATDGTGAGTVIVPTPVPSVPAAPTTPVNQIPYALAIALALTALVRKGIQASGSPTQVEKGVLVLVSLVTGVATMIVLGDATLLTEVLLGALAGAGATGTYELGKQLYRVGASAQTGSADPTPPDTI